MLLGALGGVTLAVVAVVVLGVGGKGAPSPRRTARAPHVAHSGGERGVPSPRGSPALGGVRAVGIRTFDFHDPSRTITLPDGTSEPRPLLTYVRYPALASDGDTDVRDAPADRAAGPFPLIVFGHGFAVTPELYRHLLQSWVRAGYVVAAPLFPLESASAPGGPNESDLVNQPADISFVITRLLQLTRARTGPLAGLIDPRRIAVSGQSDGGDTALAVAYDARFRDPRIDAAVILSGVEIPTLGAFAFTPRAPALLAVQGTADTVNLPSETEAFFSAAPRPKYLLRLLGAQHLPPYTSEEPQLRLVERVTSTFLDAYLERRPGAHRALAKAGRVAGIATLRAEP